MATAIGTIVLRAVQPFVPAGKPAEDENTGAVALSRLNLIHLPDEPAEVSIRRAGDDHVVLFLVLDSQVRTKADEDE